MKQRTVRQVEVVLTQKSESLEFEKRNFFLCMIQFLDEINEKQLSAYNKEILKSLLIMSYTGLSYRRCYSELLTARDMGLLEMVPKRSLLCKCMNQKWIKDLLSELIQKSAIPFIKINQTLIIDSTWFGMKMYVGGYSNKPTSKRQRGIPPLAKCMKLHVGVIRDSKIIAYATTTAGTVNDHLCFDKIVSAVLNNGFNINTLLADKGYASKKHYKFAADAGIKNIYISFKKNNIIRRAQSEAWKTALNLYRNEPDNWRDVYRYRYVVEGVFSVIKRKSMNWIRTRTTIARENELLLKVLCYNLCILGKYRN